MEASSVLSTAAKNIIPPDFSLVSFEAKDTVKDALAQLIESDIYSAPVRDAAKDEWLGFLDLADIVQWIVQVFAEQIHVSQTSVAFSQAQWTPTDLVAIQTRFDSTPVRQILNISGGTEFRAVREDTPLQKVIEALVVQKLNRVAMLDARGKISAIISPSTVVSYLSKHVNELDQAVIGRSLDDARIGERTGVKSCARKDLAIVAFAKISENHISHLALTTEEGFLSGNVSLKDIKLIQIGDVVSGVQRLLDPVGEYVNEILRMNLKDPPPALHADVRDTVERTLIRLATIRIHRLYLTRSKEPSSQHRPVGVVSLRDVLSVFVKK